MLSYFIQGEVQEIVIHSGVNRATAILHPGAVYKGQTLPTQVGKEQKPSYPRGRGLVGLLYIEGIGPTHTSGQRAAAISNLGAVYKRSFYPHRHR